MGSMKAYSVIPGGARAGTLRRKNRSARKFQEDQTTGRLK